MAFRSEEEHLREQIRRVEEGAREVGEELSALERTVGAYAEPRWGLRVTGFAVLLAVTTAIGYQHGVAESAKRAAHRRFTREREDNAELDQERHLRHECLERRANLRAQITRCEDTARWGSR